MVRCLSYICTRGLHLFPLSRRFFFTIRRQPRSFFFFFNDTATTEIYTLSLHDALPIYHEYNNILWSEDRASRESINCVRRKDRKSTRLNSSHLGISYAVFCLKKKNAG